MFGPACFNFFVNGLDKGIDNIVSTFPDNIKLGGIANILIDSLYSKVSQHSAHSRHLISIKKLQRAGSDTSADFDFGFG